MGFGYSEILYSWFTASFFVSSFGMGVVLETN